MAAGAAAGAATADAAGPPNKAFDILPIKLPGLPPGGGAADLPFGATLAELNILLYYDIIIRVLRE